jgi:hypothetical protein
MNADAMLSLLLGLMILVMAALWIYALVSALQHELLDSTMKLVWVLVIILVPPLGWMIYLLVAPKRPTKTQFGMAELHHRKRKFAREAGLRPAGPQNP